MYLRGLSDDYSVDPVTGDVTSAPPPLVVDDIPVAPPPDFPTLPSTQPPSSSTPWTTLGTAALKVWSNLRTPQNAQGAPQSLPAVPPGYARINGQLVPISSLPAARAGYSPFPATGVFQGSSGVAGVLMPLAIGAGVFLVARSLMR